MAGRGGRNEGCGTGGTLVGTTGDRSEPSLNVPRLRVVHDGLGTDHVALCRILLPSQVRLQLIHNQRNAKLLQ